MSPKKKPRTFECKIEYTARGVVEVEARDEAEAKERACEAVSFTPGHELIDWDVTNVREVEA